MCVCEEGGLGCTHAFIILITDRFIFRNGVNTQSFVSSQTNECVWTEGKSYFTVTTVS